MIVLSVSLCRASEMELLYSGRFSIFTFRDFRATDRIQNLVFFDVTDPHRRQSTVYGETNPRVRLIGPLWGAAMLETGQAHRAHMGGVMVTFPHGNIQYYRRSDGHHQITAEWFYVRDRWIVWGFWDYGRFGSVGQPQILYRITERIYAGTELQYFTIGPKNHAVQFVLRIRI